MDLSQKKLTKEEWCALEVPVPDNEAKILNMIYNGWENPEIFYNTSQSLISVVKLDSTNNNFHLHFYKEYFEKILEKMIKKNNLTIQLKNILNIKKLKIKLKTSDKIRIKNVESKIDILKNDIYEFTPSFKPHRITQSFTLKRSSLKPFSTNRFTLYLFRLPILFSDL